MNYLLLRNIIETTVQNYNCKHCSSSIKERDVNILGVAGGSINLEILCPSCKREGVVKAEIGMMTTNGPITGQVFEKLKTISGRNTVNQVSVENSINDSDITNVREELKKHSSLSDLFEN